MGQRMTLGHQDLCAYQVDAGDHFGNGMLNLNTGVHFDEVVLAGSAVNQELYGAGVDVANMLGDLNGILTQSLDGLLGYGPCGCVLDYLLIAALQRAVTLAKVHDVAMLVGQDLHFDVLGLYQELLDEDVLVAEGLLGLVLDQLELAAHVSLVVAATHTAATAAGSSLQNDGEAIADGLFHCFVSALQGLGRTGDNGHIASQCGSFCGQLVAHLTQNMRGRADELDAVGLASAGKVGILRQETVTGMDGINTAALGQVDDGGDVQVSTQRRLVFTNQISLVSLGTEHTVGVFVGVHGNGMQTQVITGAENTDRDLAAVSDKNFGKIF